MSGQGSQFEHDMLNSKAQGQCEALSHIQLLDYELIFADELEAIAQRKHDEELGG